jgi:hypothetical protein
MKSVIVEIVFVNKLDYYYYSVVLQPCCPVSAPLASVRIVTKSPKVGPLLILSISLIYNNQSLHEI